MPHETTHLIALLGLLGLLAGPTTGCPPWWYEQPDDDDTGADDDDDDDTGDDDDDDDTGGTVTVIVENRTGYMFTDLLYAYCDEASQADAWTSVPECEPLYDGYECTLSNYPPECYALFVIDVDGWTAIEHTGDLHAGDTFTWAVYLGDMTEP